MQILPFLFYMLFLGAAQKNTEWDYKAEGKTICVCMYENDLNNQETILLENMSYNLELPLNKLIGLNRMF